MPTAESCYCGSATLSQFCSPESKWLKVGRRPLFLSWSGGQCHVLSTHWLCGWMVNVSGCKKQGPEFNPHLYLRCFNPTVCRQVAWLPQKVKFLSTDHNIWSCQAYQQHSEVEFSWTTPDTELFKMNGQNFELLKYFWNDWDSWNESAVFPALIPEFHLSNSGN